MGLYDAILASFLWKQDYDPRIEIEKTWIPATSLQVNDSRDVSTTPVSKFESWLIMSFTLVNEYRSPKS